jgi:hypothetical protein
MITQANIFTLKNIITWARWNQNLNQNNLYQMEDILLFPCSAKNSAKKSVGAAIRISKAIGKEERADKI